MTDRPTPQVRKGQADWPLSREEFSKRFRTRFFDPRFDEHRDEIEQLLEIAWKNYCDARKAPRTRKAGPEFADPDYDLSIEWLDARARIQQAEREHADRSLPAKALVICGAARNDKTC